MIVYIWICREKCAREEHGLSAILLWDTAWPIIRPSMSTRGSQHSLLQSNCYASTALPNRPAIGETPDFPASVRLDELFSQSGTEISHECTSLLSRWVLQLPKARWAPRRTALSHSHQHL